MKGASEVIKILNDTLRRELTAVNQYFLHASICKKWGYMGLHKKIYDESLEEMRHAERLIDRILFLEGTPMMNEPFKVAVGKDVKDMFEKDLVLEQEGIPALQKAIALCQEQGDTGTEALLEQLLVDSEAHVQWLEAQLHLIREVGQGNYCAQHIHSA